MPIINPTLPNDGEDADASDISAPITAILSVLNGNLDDDNFGSISGTKITDNSIPNVKIANASITYAKLLATIFSSQVTTFTNAGSGTGSFSYINLGGIKLLWGAFSSITTGSAGTLTIPTFFTTITSVVATAGPVSGTAAIEEYISSISTTSIVIGLNATAGAGSMPVQVIVIGT